jgi:L,D-transpeptidase ErfK/SrfK
MCRALLLLTLAGAVAWDPAPPPAQTAARTPALVGQVVSYAVVAGDSLGALSARVGVDVGTLAEANRLRPDARLRIGQVLTIDNRHVVPPLVDPITINIPQRLLYLRLANEPLQAWPVAVGRPSWRTPLGSFAIASRVQHPTWHVPVSIQAEMRDAGKPVLTSVPPGPENPLGDYFMALTLPGIGMHSTNAPSSIYRFTTHGCIRLAPDHAERVFQSVEIGMLGRIDYVPLLLTEDNGRVFVEVHRDIYRKGAPAMSVLRALASGLELDDRIDWTRASDALRAQAGIARDVTLDAPAIRSDARIGSRQR